jgi:DNA polymerase elongation subunit (family B)
MNTYYTNIAIQGNNILFRGVKDGRRMKIKVEYAPTLFLPAKKKTDWKTLFDEPLEPMKFENIRDAKDFVKRYDQVQNFNIYGNDRFEYAYIAEEFKGQIDWDINHIDVAFMDIEVGSENGFPDPYLANEPITAIAICRLNGDMVVYGCGDYVIQGEEKYIKCRDEYDLCKKFLSDWEQKCPDVITGWNIEFFDIPYIINRLRKILGPDETRKFSPWNNIWERKVKVNGRELISYNVTGLSVLDYIELYKWYAPGGKSQESYKLDNIASVELGESKLSFAEYDNLHQLYRLNYQKFIEYNIKDVLLVLRLEDKLKLIELALTLAYDTKTNYEDVFAQTRMWDALIYSHLLERGIVVPPRVIKEKTSAFEGAYVKVPQVGMHDWIASFDLNSLYPHLLIQYNISPETLVEQSDYTDEMRKVISDGVSVDMLLNKRVDTSKLSGVTLTPNGQYFRTDKQGFLAAMMVEMYEDRKKFKKLMLKCKQEYINEKDPIKKADLAKLVARYDNLQLAKKVSLNSAYGALGSQYFRFYDLRMALAVTHAGQLSIRWIENKLNGFMNGLLKTEKDYVIASDTDSIYLRLGELVDKVFTGEKTNKSVIAFMDKVCEDKIQPFIDNSYQELATYVHAYEQKMQMKREALANKGFWTAKKRYVMNVFNNEGVAYDVPDLKVMGLEMVKSSTPAVVRDKMKETIRLIVETDETTVQDYIAKFREDFKKLPVEDISFPRGINGLREYSDSVMMYKKGTPIHVRGAILYNHLLNEKDLTKVYPLIREGDKLKFTYLKTPNPIKEDVISFPVRFPKEFELERYVNYDMQFDKTYVEPIKTILSCIGWQTEKQSSLEAFFG